MQIVRREDRMIDSLIHGVIDIEAEHEQIKYS